MSNPASKRRTDEASREIAASPEEVYAAFANAAALITWLPPGNMTGRLIEYDFREDGRYSIELTYAGDSSSGDGKTTDKSDLTRGRFRTLKPGKLIVQSVEFDSEDPAFGGEMTMTWSFDRTAYGTIVSVKAEDVPPGISQADHDAGLRGSLENLANFLSRMKTPVLPR